MEGIYAGTTPLSSRLKPVDLRDSLSRWNHGRGSNQAMHRMTAPRRQLVIRMRLRRAVIGDLDR